MMPVVPMICASSRSTFSSNFDYVSGHVASVQTHRRCIPRTQGVIFTWRRAYDMAAIKLKGYDRANTNFPKDQYHHEPFMIVRELQS